MAKNTVLHRREGCGAKPRPLFIYPESLTNAAAQKYCQGRADYRF
jgi:hypothetical protein